tara:strand:- start:907 stop:2913 length:2007 start_codon:yes stop_codon:yes gene_type:complete
MLKKILLLLNIFNCNSFIINKKNIFRRTNNVVKSIEIYDDSPSNIAKKIYDTYSTYGNIENYGNFIKNLDNKNIESVSLLTQNDDIKAIVSIDVLHKPYEYDIGNMHVTKVLPSMLNNLFNNLDKAHIKYDIINLPDKGGFSQILDFAFQFAIFYFIGGYVLRFISSRGMPPGGSGMNLLNIMKRESTYQEIDDTLIDVNFTSVAGCDEAKGELMEIVDFLKSPERFENVGAKIPKGALLEGPPGTGKTLLAQAVAGEAGVNYLYASGSQFIEMFVGVGASRVRDLFKRAKELSPCVIFLDEIDAIGRQRGAGLAGGNDEREQTLNEILTNMDGFIKNEGIIVIAATNRADILDNALTRPGRFDRIINVGLPDLDGRKKIIDIHFNNKPLSDETKKYLEDIAKLTSGFSGADIANLANEAAILSVRNNNTYITNDDIYGAFEKKTIGLPVTKDTRSDEIINLVSAHEIGHALTAHYFNDLFNIQKVTINSNRNGAGGYTLFIPKDEYEMFPTKKFMLANLIISLGGRAAEEILFKNINNSSVYLNEVIFKKIGNLDVTTGATNDLKQANTIARRYISLYGLGKNIALYDSDNTEQPFLGRQMATGGSKLSEYVKENIDKEVDDLVNWAYNAALYIVNKNYDSFIYLKNILISKKNLSGEDFNKIILNF